MKKTLSPKSQKMLDKMMEQHREEAPQVAKIVSNIKKLSTPEGRLEIAKQISKQRKDNITAPLFSNRDKM